jgi:hypothetical protein
MKNIFDAHDSYSWTITDIVVASVISKYVLNDRYTFLEIFLAIACAPIAIALWKVAKYWAFNYRTDVRKTADEYVRVWELNKFPSPPSHFLPDPLKSWNVDSYLEKTSGDSSLPVEARLIAAGQLSAIETTSAALPYTVGAMLKAAATRALNKYLEIVREMPPKELPPNERRRIMRQNRNVIRELDEIIESLDVTELTETKPKRARSKKTQPKKTPPKKNQAKKNQARTTTRK